MTSNIGDSGLGARLRWAFFTPVILAVAAFSIIGFFFIPAICVYLDNRSKTYTGAVSVLAVAVLLSLLLGVAGASVCIFIAVATVAATVLTRTKLPFATGLLGSTGAGVLGAVVMLGILGGSVGKPLNEAVAALFCNGLSGLATAGNPLFLNLFAAQLQAAQQADTTGFQIFTAIPQQILDLSVADKLAIIRPVMEQYFAAYIPAWALAIGMLTGAAGYYLPVLVQDRRPVKSGKTDANIIKVPAFPTFRIPKYVVISIIVLLLVANFGIMAGNDSFTTIYTAAYQVLTILMTFQALALISFFLTRKKLITGLQLLILIPAAVLFSCILTWVGLFDVLFDMRTVALRVEAVKTKGKQVFTPDGLDELRKMDQSKKDKKNDKDGEDKKQ